MQRMIILTVFFFALINSLPTHKRPSDIISKCQGIIGRQGDLAQRFVLMGDKWHKKHLTYYIENYPTNTIDLQRKEDVDRDIALSFKDWSDVADLHFSKGDINSDITIGFYPPKHGHTDFDSGDLAHASGPGDYTFVHFNTKWQWSSIYNEDRGVSLRQVATHEFGHNLGLEHSLDTNAVMYGSMLWPKKDFKIGADDIAAIIHLYGENQSNKPTPTESPMLTSLPNTPPPPNSLPRNTPPPQGNIPWGTPPTQNNLPKNTPPPHRNIPWGTPPPHRNNPWDTPPTQNNLPKNTPPPHRNNPWDTPPPHRNNA